MRHHRFLLSFLVGFIAWTLGNMVWSNRGAQARAHLMVQIDTESQVLSRLTIEKEILQQDFEALLRDPQRVRLAARQLGYYEQDEYLLAVFGKSTTTLSPEKAIRRIENRHLSESKTEAEIPWAALLGGVFFLMTLVTLELGSQATRVDKSENRVKEIPGDAQTS